MTIDEVAAAALRALRRKEMGEQLATLLDDDESEWLMARGVSIGPGMLSR